ncbi:MAG: DinB family protein [Vicinamibacterales bacterium]
MTGRPDDRTARCYDVAEAVVLLERTPRLLDVWLRDLPRGWLLAHEGAETWSPLEVVRHLVHAERSNFFPRVEWILAHGESAPFPPFERLPAPVRRTASSLGPLLDELSQLRLSNLRALACLDLDEAALDRAGRHPSLGRVTLRQLLATWMVHDQDHVVQIARVLARQYAKSVGPWRAALRVISGDQG